MELLESDVWDVMEVTTKVDESELGASVGLLSRQLQASARLIPIAKKPIHEPQLAHQSEPVNIPNWPKYEDESNDNEEYEDGYDCRLPPHEWLAKKQARNEITSFSVCEGAGRTLKGRDLSKVRHAVLTKTGFI